jgi:hypothetical protein
MVYDYIMLKVCLDILIFGTLSYTIFKWYTDTLIALTLVLVNLTVTTADIAMHHHSEIDVHWQPYIHIIHNLSRNKSIRVPRIE